MPVRCPLGADGLFECVKVWQSVRMRKPRFKDVRRRIPPPPIIEDERVGIRLTQHLVAWIDPADWPEASQYVWCAAKHPHTWYAVTTKVGRTLYLHDLIMKPGPGFEVDHFRNPSGLFCQRWNLRNVSHAENMRNSRRCVGGRCFQKMLEHAALSTEEKLSAAFALAEEKR